MEAVRWIWMKGWRWKSVAMGTERGRISQKSILLPVRVRMDTAVTLSATPQRTPPPAALPHHSCEFCMWACILCVSIVHLPFNSSLSQLHVQWRSRGLAGSEDLEESHHAGVAGRSQSQVSFSFILASADVLWWTLTCRWKCVVIYCFVFQVCKCVSAARVWWYRPWLSQHCTQVSRWDSFHFLSMLGSDIRDAENLNIIL